MPVNLLGRLGTALVRTRTPPEPMGSVIQINVNPKGGVPKYRIEETLITARGVKGDKQKHRRFHGGPLRAVSLYAQERISALQAEGHPIEAGSTGENLTIQGLDWDTLKAGSQLRVGKEVLLEITSYAAPCKQIADSFSDGRFERVSQKTNPGWSRLYAKVHTEGYVREGDPVVCEEPQNAVDS